MANRMIIWLFLRIYKLIPYRNKGGSKSRAKPDKIDSSLRFEHIEEWHLQLLRFSIKYKTIKVLHRRFLCQSSTINRVDYHNKPINILSAKRHIVYTWAGFAKLSNLFHVLYTAVILDDTLH